MLLEDEIVWGDGSPGDLVDLSQSLGIWPAAVADPAVHRVAGEPVLPREGTRILALDAEIVGESHAPDGSHSGYFRQAVSSRVGGYSEVAKMATICAMQHRNRLYNLRKQQGLSQDALAKAAGTTKGQIGKLEMGKRRLTADWIMRLSRALRCQPADLLGQSSDESKMSEAPDIFLDNQPENELDDSLEITQVNPRSNFQGEQEMASVDPVYHHVQQIQRNQAEFEDRFDATAERFGERVDSLTKAVLELLDELKKDRPKRTTQLGKK